MILHICGIRLGLSEAALAWSTRDPGDTRLSSGYWTNLVGIKVCCTPMVAIFTPDMTLQSFGYEAEQLMQAQNSSDCLVFKNIMHQIFCARPNVKATIMANNGVDVPSEKVMLNVLLDIIAKSETEKSETKFVLTLPSAINDRRGAIQFLEKVAKKAQICDVLVISEATAISYCCKYEDGSWTNTIDCKLRVILECEDDYINCSVVQENEEESMATVLQNLNEKSFHNIKLMLENIFEDISWNDLLNEFKNNRTEYNDFIHSIRTKFAHAGDEKPVTLYLPSTFIRHLDKIRTKITLQHNDIIITKNKLQLTPSIVRNKVLKKVGENIVRVLKKSFIELRTSNNRPIEIVFAGTLSRFVVLQKIIKSAFPDYVLITSRDKDPSVDVVKGAVLYGKKTIQKMENGDKDLAAPKVVTSCEVQRAVGSTKTAQCATGNTKTAQCATGNTKTAQCATGNTKTAQCATGNTKTAQCATGNTKPHWIASKENTAQLVVRPRKTLQCAEGHAKQSSTSNDRLPEYVAKKVDDRVDVGILNKNTALKAKNKKRGKKCIIL